MSEDPLLIVLDDPLVLDVVLHAQLVERVGHERQAVAEDVDVDVRALADVAGADAADQPGPESGQQPHEPQGVEPHVAQVSSRLGPSCIRAMAWIWSRISWLLGRSPGR